MKNETPTHIRIGGFDYQIEEVDKLNNGRADLNGEINYSKLTIRVDKDHAPQFRQAVLWHEVIHGIADQAGIELEESVVTALGYGIIQVLRDNPQLGVIK